MVDAQSSFWTPARIAVVIGVVLLVVLLAYDQTGREPTTLVVG